MESTLAIIKPDATARNLTGEIIRRLEQQGLTLAALKMVHLSKEQAEGFYDVHRERSFFSGLTDFMSEGPIVVMVLKGEGAIQKWRTIMGATDPARADPGTIRQQFGENIERNSCHGSDSPESARFEIAYFFNQLELLR